MNDLMYREQSDQVMTTPFGHGTLFGRDDSGRF